MQRTNEVIVAGFGVGLLYSAVLVVIYITFRYPLVEIFAPPEGDFSAIRELSAFMMLGTLQLRDRRRGPARLWRGPCAGAGDTRWLMVASVSLHWAMLVATVHHYSSHEAEPQSVVARLRCARTLDSTRLFAASLRRPLARPRRTGTSNGRIDWHEPIENRLSRVHVPCRLRHKLCRHRYPSFHE